MSTLLSGLENAQLEQGQADERPLTDQERALLQRLLSDPFSYPQVFKTWLVAFLEGSDLLLPRSSVQGLTSLLGSGGGRGILGLLPAGMILPYAGATAPEGAYFCNGAAYSRTGHKRLFDAIGTVYGPGDGTSTFNVPDMRRRLPFGAGASIGLGASDGRAEASRHIDHHHNFNQTSGGAGSHTHGVSVSGSTDATGNHDHAPPGGSFLVGSLIQTVPAGGSTFYSPQNVHGRTAVAGQHQHVVSASGSTDSQGSHQHNVNGDTSGGFDNNRPAFLVVGFIINY